MTSLIYNVISLAVQVASGNSGPPPPASGDTRGPQLPLDENIWIIIAAGLIFGIYIAYKNLKVTNKAS